MSSVVVLGPKDFLNCVFHFFISIIMLQGKKKESDGYIMDLCKLPQIKQNSRHPHTRGKCSKAGALEFFHDCQKPYPVNSFLNLE